MRKRRVLTVLTLGYVGFVLWVTLNPAPYDVGSETSVVRRVLGVLAQSPLTAWLTFDRLEFTANVAMFVPLGLLVSLLAGPRRWWIGVVAGLALTLFVEGFQGAFLPARYATVSDLVANTLGAVIGAALAALLHRRARRGAPTGPAPTSSQPRRQ